MGLFDKKYCDICGEKIGILGNKKLEDGNMCKECAAKLSPWFSERKQSTVEEIKEQLAYREANKEEVNNFRITRTLGYDTKVLLDEDAHKFIVTSARSLANANPDVLDFADVTGCTMDIQEGKTELKQKGADGKEVSYDPPRYSYDYDFYMTVNVNHKYFNQMRFRLNPSTVEIDPEIIQFGGRPAQSQQAAKAEPFGGKVYGNIQLPGSQSSGSPKVATGTLHAGMNQQPQRPAGGMVSVKKVDPTTNVKYMEYYNAGEEIKAALLQIRQDERAAAGPKTAVVCPYCGATTVPDASGRCEYCGAAIV